MLLSGGHHMPIKTNDLFAEDINFGKNVKDKWNLKLCVNCSYFECVLKHAVCKQNCFLR